MSEQKEYLVTRPPKMRPTHPGAIVAEALEATGVSITTAAAEMHISRKRLADIVGERTPITADLAVRIGQFLGNGPGLWLRLQSAHDV